MPDDTVLTFDNQLNAQFDWADDWRVSIDLRCSDAVVRAYPNLNKQVLDILMMLWPRLNAMMFEALEPMDSLLSALDPSQHLHFSFYLVDNPQIQALNAQHRGQDKPTDVLTFNLFDPATDNLPPPSPDLALGDIMLSLDYALDATDHDPANPVSSTSDLIRYLVERVCHGYLHLFGVHHDSDDAFRQVVAIQNRVLSALFA
ncbi:MAG: rRNA maturation RNase YbeY [Cyanobacteria bacterium HKST-UBA06]|nr:rRNA maturation RNase YbeY [Cyanobacteria bacterium HKST-UBA06]